MTRLLSLLACGLLGAGLVAGCGGGGGEQDPQQVIDATFSNDEEVQSAVIDIVLSGSAEGEQGGSFDASVSGPVQSEEGAFPQFDLTARLTAEGQGQSLDFEGGVISTGKQGFVSYQGADYEVPAQLFDQISSAYVQSAKQSESRGQDAGAFFERLGIDPSQWLTNLQNEGDADVDGTETVHIHGDADVPQILEDVQKLAREAPTGTAQQLTPDQIRQVEESISEATVDVYSGKDDDILRRLQLNLTIQPTDPASAGVDSVDVEFSLTLSDVNQAQTIETPTDAQPFSQLEKQLGIPNLLGSLGAAGAASGAAGGAGGANEAYLECIAAAQTSQEADACASKL